MNAIVVERSQHSRGASSGFGGPDRYVAVVAGPNAALAENKALSERNKNKYGWVIRYLGEGYTEHTGPRSVLGRIRMRAHALADALRQRPEEIPPPGQIEEVLKTIR